VASPLLAAYLAAALGQAAREASASLDRVSAAIPDPARAVSLAQLDAWPLAVESESVAKFPVAERSVEQSSLEVVADLDQAGQERPANLDQARQEVLASLDREYREASVNHDQDERQEEQTAHLAHRCNTKLKRELVPY
jgi:hypothetical protein